MGSAVATLLLKRGYDLTVWNRTPGAAEPLVAGGATQAETAALAVADAELVFTMVHDDEALAGILFDQGVLAAIPAGATHVSLSTISPALSNRLTEEHAAHGQHYVSCPVFGRPAIAAEGKLWLAVAGPESVITPILPVLDTFSRGYTLIGEKPSSANAVKIGGNFLITAMIASLSEGMVFAEAHGIAPELYLEAVNAALFQSQFYTNYGKVMLNPPEQASATVELGAKDTRLFREAAEQTGIRTPLAALFEQNLREATEAGLGKADWAAGYYQIVQQQLKSPASTQPEK